MTSLHCRIAATETISDFLGTKDAKLGLRVEHHDREAMHDAAETALVVESVEPGFILQQPVANAHGHAADEIDTSVWQVLEGGVASLDSKNLAELIDYLRAERVLALHGGSNHIMTVDLVGSLGMLAGLEYAVQ